MTNILIKDGAGISKYMGASGAGSDADPFIHVPQDLMLEIARGNVSGFGQVNKFGENSDIADGVTEDIWDSGGTYAYPATALMTKLSQTADQTAMRGQTIEVQGLDANWALTVQTKDLDASLTTTAVTLDTPLIRVFRMKVLADVVGTSNIRCHNDAESVDYAVIQTGNNQTLMALYTVPAGKTAYMTSYYCDTVESTGKEPKSTEFTLWVADRANSYEFQLKHEKGVAKGDSGFQHYFRPYMKVNEKSDIRMRAVPSGEDAHVHAGFDLILIDN